MPRVFQPLCERVFVQVNGLSVHVVLPHPVTNESFVLVGDPFSAVSSHDPLAVVVDLPGLGGSSHWSGKRTYDDYVELAVAVSNQLSVPNWRVESTAPADVEGQLAFLTNFSDVAVPRADGAHLASIWDLVRSAEVFESFAHRTGDRRQRERPIATAGQLHDRAVCIAT